MFHRSRDGADETVGNENSEEGPHERRADLVADGGRVSALERGHGIHNTQYRRDDAEARQCVSDLLHRGSGLVSVLMVSFQLLLEQAFQLVWVEAAAHHEAQAIAD